MAKAFLICGVSIVLGVIAGVGVHRTRTTDPASVMPLLATQHASSVLQTLPLQTQSVGANGLDAAQIRAMMREELAGALARQQPGPGGTAPSAKADEPVSPEIQRKSQQAVQEANALIASGEWGDEQRESFHQKMAFMSAAQQEEAMQRLVQALDSGSLKVSTLGPPL
jgi:hypothetical protein